jgi:glycosyltransferase involved in cell wall biosynthesis
MKILYVDPMSRKNLGVYDKNLLENIEGEKYFFASRGLQFMNISNTSIIYNYNYYEKKGISKVISYTFSQVKLFNWILINNPDIIHIQWIKMPYFDVILLLLLKIINKNLNILFTAHDLLPHDTGRKYYRIYNILYHLFDGIIVHTKTTKNDIIKLFSISDGKICIIPHGTLKFNVSSSTKTMFRKKLVFSIAGNIHYYKGIDILIDAWLLNSTLIKDDNILLVIAGNGKLPERNIPGKSNIEIINKLLTDEEYQSIINNTDIGILPYRQISQSGVLLSFLSAHKPVIVSNCGGLVQPFEIGQVGWILNELTPISLADQIIDIISNRILFEKIKYDKLLWRDIDNYYSWTRIGRLTSNYYNMILSK